MRRLALTAFALVPLLLAAPRARSEPSSPWEDEALVAEALEKACAAVEAECGETYVTRPTLKTSTREEIEAVVRREAGPALEKMPKEQAEQVSKMISLVAGLLLAKYEPDSRLVHVVPENVARLAKQLDSPGLLDADVLRIVLVHEAVHALDFQRHPDLLQMLELVPTDQVRQALNAVAEGHAQFVAERVALAWGLEPAFQTFTGTITKEVPIASEVMRVLARTIAAEAEFAYLRGHDFFRAVHARKGQEGVRAVLEAPPRKTRVIERPELWLDPPAEEEVDLEAALAPVRAALAEGGWPPQGVRVLDAQLKVQIEMLPEAEREEAVRGYEDGFVAVGSQGGGSALASIALLRFADEERAEAWMAVERRINEIKDERMKEGPIRVKESAYESPEREDGIRVLIVRKVMVIPGSEMTVESRVYAVSRFVLEQVVVNVPEDLAKALGEAVEKVLLDLAAAVPAEAPVR